ncbi:sugar ABC transporter ATP-binding protein [Thalassovita aquimarina]|uniref:Sugar ABC transporter ATP-binding protein n=1 Tax=Thalassovita aquimarina TaxID=2785917 RepID=A0ABS5HUQ5_9RHOB|nr:sugar ABC transporter ATP-binding protein [Thalassovita aquimarina]MBR9652710.1 sugar ABC transporter ATP-binding protein [Thalassovita aquimarina]
MPPTIEVTNLSKAFGSTQALSAMLLTGLPGEVHAVMGENGAGKSTLMKVLSGVHRADTGEVRLNGAPVSFHTPRDAQEAGISTIFQEFSLLRNLSVQENLFLGKNGIPAREQRARCQEVLARLGLNIRPETAVEALSVGEQQMVEIAKGLLADAKVFIFDEPTAALAAQEVETLFDLIRRLATEGCTIFYVSHRIPEIFAICDRITVMKDGCYVTTLTTAATDHDEVVEAMVGRPLEELFAPRATQLGQRLLHADQLEGDDLPAPVSLTLHAGEIVGLSGLEGQGQQALMRLLAGFAPATGGALRLGADQVDQLDARRRISLGLGFVPESRKDDGLFPSLSILANMETGSVAPRGLSAWFTKPRAAVEAVMRDLSVKAEDPYQNVMQLSGGNQQKVVLGRWLVAGTRVLLCEEPTRGVDVGAKREIYLRLREFAANGGTVFVSSREMPELIGLCDRIVVIREGRLATEMPATEATEINLLAAAIPGQEDAARTETPV